MVERMALAQPPADAGQPVDDPLLAPWRDQLAGLDDPWPAGPTEVADDPLDLPPPPPPSVVADLLARPGARPEEEPRDDADTDTMWLTLVPRQRVEEPIVHPLDTPPSGLRKFDLGTVPASVTPPRTWRKAAWFAVGTSAAVACGLALAAVRLVEPPWPGHSIDALPSYPTRPLEIERPPLRETSEATPTSDQRRPVSSTPDAPDPTTSGAPYQSEAARPVGSPGGQDDPDEATAEGDDAARAPAEAGLLAAMDAPNRTTVGPEPVTPTAPQAMGDRTEQYYALVITDPVAAHELCTGSLASEGPEGIAARYDGVARVEVQEIVIDRNHAVTTSTVRVIYKNGTESVEKRQLTFTWGGDPRISDETVTS